MEAQKLKLIEYTQAIIDAYGIDMIRPVVEEETRSFEDIWKVTGIHPHEVPQAVGNLHGFKDDARKWPNTRGFNAVNNGGSGLAYALCSQGFSRDYRDHMYMLLSPEDFLPYQFRLIFCRGWEVKDGMAHNRKGVGDKGVYKRYIDANAYYWEQLFFFGKGDLPEDYIPTFLLLSEMSARGTGLLHLTFPFKMNGTGTKITDHYSKCFHDYSIRRPVDFELKSMDEITDIPLVEKSAS